MSRPFDDARAALYVAAPSEFVARRKELAAQLKAKGDPAGAKLLGALPKPSAHAWVVNRLFADGALAPVFAAGTASRSAQAALMRGESDPATAKQAQEAHKATVAAACARATTLLEGSEAPMTGALTGKVAALVMAITLRGSFAPYPDGCVAGDVELPSLEELASGLVSVPSSPTAPVGAAANDATPPPAPVVVIAPTSNAEEEARKRAAEERARAQAEARRAWEAAAAAAAHARAARDGAKAALDDARAEVERAKAAWERARASEAALEEAHAASDAVVREREAERDRAEATLAALTPAQGSAGA